MFKWFTARRRDRIVRRHPIADALWHDVVSATPVLAALDQSELRRLREMATVFVAEKSFVGTHELVVTDYMRVAVAAQACLLILNLGLGYYRDWYTVVLYPTAFVASRETEDEDGVVHTGYEELDGESMTGGPMALSWEEVDPRTASPEGNVVLHECAHKLDELTGDPNGLPPLHMDMRVSNWSAAFTAAFAHFDAAVASADELEFDDYAATDASEFFAVMTESFFSTPQRLREEYPAVYEQLARFFRQDPARRLSRSAPVPPTH
ncbi:MAG: zinc-dependent peptidase [Gammaproteobacteria bacterium]|nr:zinc-dependent peptidase [Gammaproteobacteria bacterium]